MVHEKAVKMQRLQILLARKPRVHIWTEIILANYERPHFKNGRAQREERRRPSDCIWGVIALYRGLLWVRVVETGSQHALNIKCAEYDIFGMTYDQWEGG